MSINIGSTLGTVFFPILRSDEKCFGKECYPLAFGVSSAFMFIAICSFMAGTRFYKKSDKQQIKNNAIIDTIKCLYRAVWNKLFSSKEIKKESWLHYADTHHSKQVKIKKFTK